MDPHPTASSGNSRELRASAAGVVAATGPAIQQRHPGGRARAGRRRPARRRRRAGGRIGSCARLPVDRPGALAAPSPTRAAARVAGRNAHSQLPGAPVPLAEGHLRCVSPGEGQRLSSPSPSTAPLSPVASGRTAAGRSDLKMIGSRASSEPRHGEIRQAGTSFVSQTEAAGRSLASQPVNSLERYGSAPGPGGFST